MYQVKVHAFSFAIDYQNTFSFVISLNLFPITVVK